MSTKRATKRALLTSILAICLCLVMLIGSTFAWFTDTASTSVNKIQSGKLDVVLEMQNAEEKWVSAENQTLTFKTADNRTAENIFWEPGCRYELPALRVRNDGNLALKYKIVITGIKGDAELNKVIDWTVTYQQNGETKDYDLTAEHHLGAKTSDSAPADEFVIKGVMQESAGNEYMDMTIEGIGITILATQDTVEKDSIDEKYDEKATYPAALADIEQKYTADGTKMPAGVEIVNNEDGTFVITLKDEESFIYFTQVFDRAAAFAAREAAWNTEGFTKYPYEYNQANLNMWYGSYCARITVKMGCDVDLNNITVTPFGFNGYEFNFDGNGHTIKNAKVVSSSGNTGFFAARVNISNVTLENIHVSATGCDSVAVVSGAPNSNITGVTVKNCSVTGGKYTGAIAGYDYGNITNCTVVDTIVCGQYKVGGIVGYTCTDNAEQQRMITGNTLTGVTVKGDNIWAGKESNGFVIGKIVGNWNAASGTCNNNTFTGTTDATADIGEIESGCSVTL